MDNGYLSKCLHQLHANNSSVQPFKFSRIYSWSPLNVCTKHKRNLCILRLFYSMFLFFSFFYQTHAQRLNTL